MQEQQLHLHRPHGCAAATISAQHLLQAQVVFTTNATSNRTFKHNITLVASLVTAHSFRWSSMTLAQPYSAPSPSPATLSRRMVIQLRLPMREGLRQWRRLRKNIPCSACYSHTQGTDVHGTNPRFHSGGRNVGIAADTAPAWCKGWGQQRPMYSSQCCCACLLP